MEAREQEQNQVLVAQEAVAPRAISGPDMLVTYSNRTKVSVTPEEAVLEFGQRCLDDPEAVLLSARVFLSLPEAKRVAAILQNLIAEHEKMFGEIVVQTEQRLTPEGAERVRQMSQGKAEGNE